MENSNYFEFDKILPLIRDVHDRLNQKEKNLEKLNFPETDPFKLPAERLKLINQQFISQTYILQAYLKNIIENQVFLEVQKLSHPSKIHKIGISFLKSSDIFRPRMGKSIIPAIDYLYWSQVIPYVSNLEKFNQTITNLGIFFKDQQNDKIEQELNKVPIDIDDLIKDKYRMRYYETPISFKEFLEIEHNSKGDQFIETEIDEDGSQTAENLRDQFEKALERKKNQELKQKQTQSFDEYKRYFKMSDRDLDRIKRKNENKRKYSKKSRRSKY